MGSIFLNSNWCDTKYIMKTIDVYLQNMIIRQSRRIRLITVLLYTHFILIFRPMMSLCANNDNNVIDNQNKCYFLCYTSGFEIDCSKYNTFNIHINTTS